ncbi:MAG TPA: DUF4185 domain-containing protein [Smithella sp.]|nr:DUF4185 domain-containing protein [Smithella sp.]
MTKKLLLIFLLFLSINLCSCSSFFYEQSAAEVSHGHCLPVFPDQNGWYGGDGVYSISLDRERTLWLFGDTFVSRETGRKDRVDMDFVAGTTLAISTCSINNEFKIQYYLKEKNKEFVSSFGEDDEWLWPQDPFIVHHVLYIPLIAVTATNKDGELFNFKIIGHKFARIKDYSAADPYKWNPDYIDLTQAIPSDIIAFATTSVVYKDDVYFYPLYSYARDKAKVFGNIIARIPISKLNDPAGAIEYFMKDGTWQNKLDPTKIKIVFDAGVSEFSVRYHTSDKKWIAVYLTTRNKGNQFLYQIADKPEGPWSEPKILGDKIPEVNPQSPLYDKNNFCYAGKEHVEFSSKKNLIVTYVCNSAEDPQHRTSFVRRHLFLYRPVVRSSGY